MWTCGESRSAASASGTMRPVMIFDYHPQSTTPRTNTG
jgi:hypothetical protein